MAGEIFIDAFASGSTQNFGSACSSLSLVVCPDYNSFTDYFIHSCLDLTVLSLKTESRYKFVDRIQTLNFM